MKENELRKHAVCSKCGNKIGHTGLPFFWVVKVSQYGIKIDALRRNAGLTMFLGSTELANVMGTNEGMAEQIQTINITLCQNCALPTVELLDASTNIKAGE